MIEQRASRGDQAGFALLDVVIGMALLTAALMAAAQLVMDSSNLRHVVETKRLVVETLDQQVKAVEVTPWADLQDEQHGRAFAVSQEGGLNLQAPPGDPDGVPGRIAIREVAKFGPDELVEVDVAVDWTDRRGPRSLQRSLRISRVGAR